MEFRAKDWRASPGITKCEAPQSRQTRTLGKTKVAGLSRIVEILHARKVKGHFSVERLYMVGTTVAAMVKFRW